MDEIVSPTKQSVIPMILPAAFVLAAGLTAGIVGSAAGFWLGNKIHGTSSPTPVTISAPTAAPSPARE